MSVFFGGMFGGVTNVASIAPNCPQQNFFSLPTWYRYLDVEKDPETGKCEVEFALTDKNDAFNGDGLLKIGLAVIDILIRVAGMVSLGFVLFAGFKYMTSQGSPEGTKAALSTIINASIGLLIAILAAATVAYIGFSLG